MKTSNKSPLILTLISLLLFSCAFSLAYLQDLREAEKISRLVFSHYSQIRLAKDDMGLIDLGKQLENMNGILGFKAVKNGRILLSGGNQTYLPAAPTQGIHFIIPSSWICLFVLNLDPLSPETLNMAFRLRPGPLLWGFFALGSAWIMGGVFFWRKPRTVEERSPNILSAIKPVKADPLLSTQGEFSRNGASNSKSLTSFLLLDKHCFIRQASPTAAKFLKIPEPELLGRHLLDINPDPAVMQAIGKKGLHEFKVPFPGFPPIHLTLETLPEGYRFVLNEI